MVVLSGVPSSETLLTLETTLVLFTAAIPPIAIPDELKGTPGVSESNLITPAPGVD